MTGAGRAGWRGAGCSGAGCSGAGCIGAGCIGAGWAGGGGTGRRGTGGADAGGPGAGGDGAGGAGDAGTGGGGRGLLGRGGCRGRPGGRVQEGCLSQNAAFHGVAEGGEVAGGLVALEQGAGTLHFGIEVVEVMKEDRLGKLGHLGGAVV